MSSGEGKDTRTGLYYFDRFGNLELLYRDAGHLLHVSDPAGAAARAAGHAPSTLDPGPGRRGRVPARRRAAQPLPAAGRPARSASCGCSRCCRRPHAHGERPRIGHANAENARMLLGHGAGRGRTARPTSARRPASRSISRRWTPTGRAVQSMRSVDLPPARRAPRLRRLPRAARAAPPPAGPSPPSAARPRGWRRARRIAPVQLPAAWCSRSSTALRALPRRPRADRKSKLALTGEAAGRSPAPTRA